MSEMLLHGKPLSEYTIQDLKASIQWRRAHINGIARIVNFLTEKQLEKYEVWADEIFAMEAEIFEREKKSNDLETKSG